MTFTYELWVAAAPIYQEILEHPFLQGLSDGTLPEDRFRDYVLQDYHYLRGFSRALAQIASRAPSDDELEFFASSAANVVVVEHQLHQGFLAEFDVSVDEVEPTLTTNAYIDFMRASAGSSYLDGVAAVLACYWIYREVGAHLVTQGSPNPKYQKWIDTYAEESFAATVDRLLLIVDALEPDRVRFTELWLRGCRYEWMFWDAAWLPPAFGRMSAI